jgi:hypothetical protein
MTSVEFSVLVLYSQVTVFDPSLERPFNDWTDKHVAQGFSWRPRSAAFRTIAEDGPHLVAVLVDSAQSDQPTGADRIIDVPFEVRADGRVEIGSISASSVLEIPRGSYALRFECYEPVSSQPARIRFLFIKDPNPTFRIVRADPELSPDGELLLSTSAA